MWVSHNVKVMNSVRTQKIYICSHFFFFQHANGMKSKRLPQTDVDRVEEEGSKNKASDE